MSKASVVAKAAAGALAASLLSHQVGVSRAEDVYENCDAIGDGLKAEFWKRFHSNIDILSMEDESVQLMITHLRDGKTSRENFQHASSLLRRIFC